MQKFECSNELLINYKNHNNLLQQSVKVFQSNPVMWKASQTTKTNDSKQKPQTLFLKSSFKSQQV